MKKLTILLLILLNTSLTHGETPQWLWLTSEELNYKTLVKSDWTILKNSWGTPNFEYAGTLKENRIWGNLKVIDWDGPKMTEEHFFQALPKFAKGTEILKKIKKENSTAKLINEEIYEGANHRYATTYISSILNVNDTPTDMLFLNAVTWKNDQAYHHSFIIPREAPDELYDIIDTILMNFEILQREEI